MQIERTFSGLEIRLRATGAIRIFPIAFLLFWLAGWAVGEVTVCVALGKGVWAFFHPADVGPERASGVNIPTLGTGIFLLIWLTFWTTGGLAALTYLLRLLCGKIRIEVKSDRLDLTEHLGFIVKRRRILRADVRRFRVTERQNSVVAQSALDTVVTYYGTPGERTELAALLNAEWKLDANATTPEADFAAVERQLENSGFVGRLLLPLVRRWVPKRDQSAGR